MTRRSPTTIDLQHRIAQASAAALVAASAGFGAVYAWTTGSHHGPVLGSLTVLLALGLEGAKPFAIEGAFSAFRSWSFGRAAALATLGVASVLYSLSAELSLVASIRADRAAERTHAADQTAAVRARYGATKDELAALPASRPAGTIEADVARLKTTPGLVSCDDPTATGFGPISRRVCGELAALKGEAEVTAQRERLKQALALAERDLGNAGPATTKADPAASALATYAEAVGYRLQPATLSEWLTLIPVLALELGSALALVLVNGTRRSTPAAVLGTPSRAPPEHHPEGRPASNIDLTPDAGIGPVDGQPADPWTGTTPVALRAYLEGAGGTVRTGQRALARALGASTTDLHRTLHSLASAGVIAMTTAPTGTELRLVP